MTGFLATFAIAVAGTVLGLIIARFSSNTSNESAKAMRELEEQQRQLLDALDEVREIRHRLESEKQTSTQQTGALL